MNGLSVCDRPPSNFALQQTLRLFFGARRKVYAAAFCPNELDLDGGGHPQMVRVELTSNGPQVAQHLSELLREIAATDGSPRTDEFPSLRAVDAKVRETKMVLQQAGASTALQALERDTDFQANSRRVRLEALANHIRTAQRFIQTGSFESKKQPVKGPKLTALTSIITLSQ